MHATVLPIQFPHDRVTVLGRASEVAGLPLPLATPKISCGFPSPATDHAEERLDLVRRLVENPEATYFAIAHGDSMEKAGILDRAILVIDRSLLPQPGSIVLAAIDGDFTCKRLHITGTGHARLVPESSDPRFKPIEPRPEEDFVIWGVVRAAVNEFVKSS